MERKNVKNNIYSYIIVLNFIFSSFFIFCAVSYSLLYKIISLYSAILFIFGLIGYFYTYKLKYNKNKINNTAFWLIFLLNSIFLGFLCINFLFSTKNYPQENYNISVILGTSTENNMPSPLLKQRLDLSLDNLNENKDNLFIVSGTKNEANVMKSYLLNKNIQNEKIIKDEKAFDTYTNIKNTLKIIKDNNFDGKLFIFTNDFHCLRTTFYANNLTNMPFQVICSKSDFFTFVVLSFREFLAFFKAIIITSIKI